MRGRRRRGSKLSTLQLVTLFWRSVSASWKCEWKFGDVRAISSRIGWDDMSTLTDIAQSNGTRFRDRTPDRLLRSRKLSTKCGGDLCETSILSRSGCLVVAPRGDIGPTAILTSLSSPGQTPVKAATTMVQSTRRFWGSGSAAMSCRVEQTILRQCAMTVCVLLDTSSIRAINSKSAPKVEGFFVLADRARKTANILY
jgi:hypothetical protein